MKCPFNVGDEVRILPEMSAWLYFVFPMRDYIGSVAKIVKIAWDGYLYCCESGCRIWLDIDGGKHYWDPGRCELILPPISIPEAAISALL